MTATTNVQVRDIPMAEILSDPHFNCRGVITPLDVVDLAQSMQERGLQQPIVVQPYSSQEHPGKNWRIVAGHRRQKAAQVLEWQTIPCIVRDYTNDVDALAENLIENIHRKQLNILQEARALANFKIAGLGQEDVARIVKQSRGWVQVRYYLLDLPKEIQAEAAAGLLTNQQIRDLYSESDPNKQYEMVKKIKDAKERGEKTPSLKKTKKSVFTKKPRNREEIFEMMEHIQDNVGNNFGTRALAWAAGEIADLDFYRDISELAKEAGISYEIPKEVMSPMSLGVNASTE